MVSSTSLIACSPVLRCARPLTAHCLLTCYALLTTCLERRLGCGGSQVARQISLERREVGCVLCSRRIEHRDHAGVGGLRGRRHLCKLSEARLERVRVAGLSEKEPRVLVPKPCVTSRVL